MNNNYFRGRAAMLTLAAIFTLALLIVLLIAAVFARASGGWQFAYDTNCNTGAAYYPGGTSGTLTLTTPHTMIGTYVISPPQYGVNVVPFATGGNDHIGWQWTPSGGSPQPLVWSYCTRLPPPPPMSQIRPANPSKGQ